MQESTRPCVLVFAGIDPSGGAGMAADIETIAALGAHALPVVTVLTVQDNDRVFSVHPVAAGLVQRQAQALLDKISVAAVKIGVVGSRANAQVLAGMIAALRVHQPELPVVFDPVLASGHGDLLSVGDAQQLLEPLFSVATLIAPNLPEAVRLCGGEAAPETQASLLLRRGCRHVLIKGGHGNQPEIVNRWYSSNQSREWRWPRLPGEFHGSGCTLASAIAALLAQGLGMEQALDMAQVFCQKALAAAYPIAPGQRIPNRVTHLKENQ